MKIGLMGAWNTDSGASVHTELLGRSLVELGHEVHVFTFFRESFHGTAIVGEDEPYVTRCFTVSSDPHPRLLATPFLTKHYDFFVVEDLGMLPQDPLGKIFHWIKKRSRTISVIHDGNLKEDPSFYQFDWDAIVCFDRRYYEFLRQAYPEEIIHIIPYPCLPWRPGDMAESRRRLGLPADRKIVLQFGTCPQYGARLIGAFHDLAGRYPLLLLVVTRQPAGLEKWKELKKRYPDLIEVREESPPLDRLYEYLHASDLLLYDKPSKPNCVTVSSTAFQCLGSGCPMVALRSGFVEFLEEAVYIYETEKELKAAVESAFARDARFRKVQEGARRYVEEHSGRRVAERFVELFRKLSERRAQ